MTATEVPWPTPGQSVRLAGVAVAFALAGLLPGAVCAQMSPEEHAKHHPGAARPGLPSSTRADGPTSRIPVEGGPASPALPAGPSSDGMRDMMKGMGSSEPPPLFPSLMELPSVSTERRDALQRQAHDRMKAGTAVLSDGLDRLSRAAAPGLRRALRGAAGRGERRLLLGPLLRAIA